MKALPIEKGVIKVVWIKRDIKNIYSKMFDSIEPAQRFGESKKDYLVFKLLWHRKFKTYSWELLPYGGYKLYQSALKLYRRHKDMKSIFEKVLKL